MLKLIQNADVYAPEHLGGCDILIAEEKILQIAPAGTIGISYDRLEKIDAGGRVLVPGLIDLHVHITGGGGEQGYLSRVPEARMEEIAGSGVTTVLGLLGTDGITRSVENLFAKTCALNAEGLTAYMLTGSYELPSVTMTGSVRKDIAVAGPCIGLKLALSDHRSSHPDVRMLIDAAAEARLAGLLSGKKGLVTIHMGSGSAGISPLFELREQSEIPIGNLLPTHMGRTDALFEQGMRWIRMGGNIDLTGSESGGAAKRILQARAAGVDLAHITISSDGYGSQPRFDAQGNCIGMSWSRTDLLLTEVRALLDAGMPLSEAVSFVTVNAADRLGQAEHKGRVAERYDADLLLLEPDRSVYGVIARGQTMVWAGKTVKTGYFGGGAK